MRVGVISDLHGNLPALEAVLAELERERVDELVCLGDVAVGPEPGPTLARVAELGCPVVLGNWDAWFADGIPRLDGEAGPKLVEMGEWWARQLSPSERALLRTFQATHRVTLDGGASVLFFHGSPQSYDDYIVATTPDAELDRMLDGAREELLVGGHTHVPLLRRHRAALLVNPGSVGLPFRHADAPVRVERWAEYGVVESIEGRISVNLRRTTYDVAAYLESARASGVPHAEWWVDCWTEMSDE